MTLSGPDAAEIQQEILSLLAAEGALASNDAADERLERLEKLGKLRADGAVTEEEFQAQKARLLGEG